MFEKLKGYPYYASCPGAMITLISKNYPCLEHLFMVPKVFEPLKFDCSTCIRVFGDIDPIYSWNLKFDAAFRKMFSM